MHKKTKPLLLKPILERLHQKWLEEGKDPNGPAMSHMRLMLARIKRAEELGLPPVTFQMAIEIMSDPEKKPHNESAVLSNGRWRNCHAAFCRHRLRGEGTKRLC